MSQRRHSFDGDGDYDHQQQQHSYADQQPQSQPHPPYNSSPQRPAAQQQQQSSYDRNSPPRTQAYATSPRNHPQTNITVPHQQYPEQAYSPTRSPRTQPASPFAHPDSSFNRLQAERRYSNSKGQGHAQVQQAYADAVTPSARPPSLPRHRDADGRIWGRELGYTNSGYSNITPGADNFGEQAAGGLTGVAMSVADQHARESGLEAVRHTPGYDHDEMHMQNYQGDYQDSQYQEQPPHYQGHSPYHQQAYPGQPPHPGSSPYEAQPYQQHPQESPFADPYARPHQRQEHSQTSLAPLGAAAFPPGMSTPQSRSTASRSPPHSFVNDPYSDNPYNDSHRYSRNLDPSLAADFDPNLIEDDGDDGLEYRREHRTSMLSLGHHSNKAAPAAAAGGIIGALGGLVGRNASGNGQQYDAVHNATPGAAGPTAYGGADDYDLGNGPEKSAWLNKQQKGNKTLWWIGSVIVALIILGAIGGGVAYALLHKSSSSSSTGGSGQSASSDTASNGDLDKNSAEIKALMNNKNLHKVFPGIDYTPMYTQYPDCLTYPASQNNVTRDLAVLSQLTNTIRLYGTDCNQTELLLHSITQLDLKDTIKVWMGVWQDTNATTNARQLAQMYDIFDTYGADPFIGVIVGNEVLFRQDMTETELAAVITGVKTNLTSKGINVAVASSDLGDNWTAAFAGVVDYIMANIHPFFAGVTAEEASAWTYEFWTGHDTILTTNTTKNIISETGWPSTGGTDCGGATTCTTGSVAGISEMNQFMDGWVCAALTNGTNYFWFEAFDEPWKIKFDTAGKAWEDQWGLMDVNRNLKPGVVIPDCGGKTV